MKKKNIVIPVFVIILALLGSTFMTVCTTDFMQQYYVSTAPTYVDFHDRTAYESIDYSKFNYEKTRRFADLRYKIEPNIYSLGRVMDNYDPGTLVRQVKNGMTLPDGCYKKGIEYCEKMLKHDYKDFHGENPIYPNNDLFRARYFSQYVFLLYLDGQTEKSKQEAEKFVFADKTEYSAMGLISFSEYFSYVYNDGDPNDKAWVLETEKYIIEYNKAVNPERDYTQVFSNEPQNYIFPDTSKTVSDYLNEMTTGYYN